MGLMLLMLELLMIISIWNLPVAESAKRHLLETPDLQARSEIQGWHAQGNLNAVCSGQVSGYFVCQFDGGL